MGKLSGKPVTPLYRSADGAAKIITVCLWSMYNEAVLIVHNDNAAAPLDSNIE